MWHVVRESSRSRHSNGESLLEQKQEGDGKKAMGTKAMY